MVLLQWRNKWSVTEWQDDCFDIWGIVCLLSCRGLGAGDVKLLCVLSAFFPELLWDIVVASFVMAAVISVGKMMIRGIRRKNIYVPGETILFSVPVGIGTGLVLLQQYVR